MRVHLWTVSPPVAVALVLHARQCASLGHNVRRRRERSRERESEKMQRYTADVSPIVLRPWACLVAGFVGYSVASSISFRCLTSLSWEPISPFPSITFFFFLSWSSRLGNLSRCPLSSNSQVGAVRGVRGRDKEKRKRKEGSRGRVEGWFLTSLLSLPRPLLPENSFLVVAGLRVG